MAIPETEQKLLESVALQNANSIRFIQKRAALELFEAKEALELKTQELTRSLARMRATLESTTDGILVTDINAKISDFNQKYISMWDIPRSIVEAADHKKLVKLISTKLKNPAQYLTRIEQIYVESLDETFDILEFLDGRVFERFTKIQFVDRKIIGRVWSFRDITDSKSGLAIKTRLAAIVESSQDGIISKRLDGTITTWNKSAEHIFGYTAEEIIGQSITKLIPEDRQSEEAFILEQLRLGRRVEDYESIGMTKDGRLINVLFTSSPLLDADGTVTGASKIVRDITARKQAELTLQRAETQLRTIETKAAREREQLLESERSARSTAERMSAIKDLFLATLSHELRTPLSAILGWSQLLKRSNRTEDDLTKGLDVIERNARLQTQLIDDLLDMSRITSGKVRLDVQPVDSASIIEAAMETVRPAAQAKGIKLDKSLNPAAGSISGDPSRLQQIIWNLLSNAIKFTPKDGRVHVVLERVNSHIEITVADTGIGIKPEFLTHVFERFRQADASTTRNHGGLGLGLAIVKHLVELHGGTVGVVSEGEGHGSTFSVRLPLMTTQRNILNETQQHSETQSVLSVDFKAPNLSEIKVLVVDDEADSRELIKRMLEDCGAEVLITGAAKEALFMIETYRPQVLVSDIGMPNVDGYELLKQVRALGHARGGRLPAIALTAFARSEDRTRALSAGFQAHISKPVEPTELIVTVANAAGRIDEPITIDRHS